MQFTLVTSLIFLFLASPVFADWQTDFHRIYLEDGIEQAVAGALREGILPEKIIEEGLKTEGISSQTLLLALYCAGISTNDAQKAATANKISEKQVTDAYEQALDQCPRFIGIPVVTTDARNITYRGDPLPGPPPVPQPPQPPTPVPPPSSPNSF